MFPLPGYRWEGAVDTLNAACLCKDYCNYTLCFPQLTPVLSLHVQCRSVPSGRTPTTAVFCCNRSLQHLHSQDNASLRLASRSVYQCITQHVPYISLLLSYTSRAKFTIGYRRRKVCSMSPSIHVRITEGTNAQVLKLAVQLLSQRAQIKELHISASNGEGRIALNTASIPTSLPIKCLASDLKTLVIDDVAIANLVNDLQQLPATVAATGGWQLQSFNLRC